MLILGKTPEGVLVVAEIERGQKHQAQVVTEFGSLVVLCDLDGKFQTGIVGQLTATYRDPIQWEFVPKVLKFAYLRPNGKWYLSGGEPELTNAGWVAADPVNEFALELDTRGTIPWQKSLFQRPNSKEGKVK